MGAQYLVPQMLMQQRIIGKTSGKHQRPIRVEIYI